MKNYQEAEALINIYIMLFYFLFILSILFFHVTRQTRNIVLSYCIIDVIIPYCIS